MGEAGEEGEVGRREGGGMAVRWEWREGPRPICLKRASWM